MARSRIGLRVAGLCALIFCLMGISANTAQALPEWTYLTPGGQLLEVKDLLPELGFTVDAPMSLDLTTKGGTKVSISCKTISASAGTKLMEGGKSTKSIAEFTGCITKLNGTTAASCEPRTGKEKGVIRTAWLLYLVILHLGAPAILGENEFPEKALADINLGEICSIGEEIAIQGHVILRDCENKFTQHLVTHLWVTILSPPTSLGVSAVLNGSINTMWIGPGHVGLQWAGLPD